MRRLKRLIKRKPGEFRLLLCLGVEVNIARLKKHIWRIQRRVRGGRTPGSVASRRIGLKNRRRQRAARPAS